jgi:hypothetical protein
MKRRINRERDMRKDLYVIFVIIFLHLEAIEGRLASVSLSELSIEEI